MKLNLTMNEVLSLAQAHSNLDGYQKQGEKGQITFVGFTLSGAAKIAIARNRKKLATIAESYTEARTELLKSCGIDGAASISPDMQRDFQAKEQEMLAHKEEIDLAQIPLAGLNLDAENNRNITPSTLAILSVVIPEILDASEQAAS